MNALKRRVEDRGLNLHNKITLAIAAVGLGVLYFYPTSILGLLLVSASLLRATK